MSAFRAKADIVVGMYGCPTEEGLMLAPNNSERANRRPMLE